MGIIFECFFFSANPRLATPNSELIVKPFQFTTPNFNVVMYIMLSYRTFHSFLSCALLGWCHSMVEGI